MKYEGDALDDDFVDYAKTQGFDPGSAVSITGT